MSLRQIAKELGITPAYLSYMVNGKRPWREDLYERYSRLVNSFVNTSQVSVNSHPHTSVARNLVGRVGVEPTTPGLKVRCSDQPELTARGTRRDIGLGGVADSTSAPSG